MTRQALALEPRDGFFCKDGRGWTTTAAGRARSLSWPHTTTVRGALRTAWGLAVEKARGRPLARDEWPDATAGLGLELVLPLRRHGTGAWQASSRLWPCPADAVGFRDDAHPVALRPRPAAPCTLGSVDEPALEGLWRATLERRDKPRPLAPWWPESAFVPWLCGEPAELPAASELTPKGRTDVHVAIDPATQTARDEMLFSTEVVEPWVKGPGGAWEWALGTVFRLAAGETPFPEGPLTLGGDRRLVWTSAVEGDLRSFPEQLATRAREKPRGLRLVVVTPACFDAGWLLPGFEVVQGCYRGHLPGLEAELVLRAAMVRRPLHVSGWNMAGGKGPGGEPRPTRRLVPPGAVYFIEKLGGAEFDVEELRRLWLVPLGLHAEDGLGRIVPGLWRPEDGRTDPLKGS